MRSIIITIVMLFAANTLSAGYITPQLQAVLDTLLPGNKTSACVHMVEKANLSQFPQNAYADKIMHLKEFALQKQEYLLAYMYSFGDKVEEIQPFWVFNGISFKGTKEVILTVAPRTDIEFVSGGESELIREATGAPPPVRQQREWNIDTVKANVVWQMGYTGDSVVICIFDSGMREDHESYGLDPNWKWRNIVNNQIHWEYAWKDVKPLNPSPTPIDYNGHGTHVGGIAIGAMVVRACVALVLAMVQS